ncbi:MAG: hypothetical protein N4A71_14960 [Carboxylicivirga sp.]|jgi:hypothetical protein|nr:hypothetical protein [Carboxylicivirga sp.]
MKSGQIRITDNKIVEVGNFEYQIKYGKAEDPTTTRYESHSTIDAETYDSIIFDNVLNHLCNKVYDQDYFHEFIGNIVFIEVVKANNLIGEFRIRFLDFDTCEEECVYSVVIEPKFDVDSQYNLAELDEPYAEYPPKKKKVVQDKNSKEIAEWVLQEKGGIKEFLLLLDTMGSLKKMKEFYSRTTLYRHVKYCEEKGYIKDGRLVRQVWLLQ